MSFFRLQTPRDMLDKAEREYARLQKNFNIDNVYNYFVTVHHISDYVRMAKAVPQKVLDDFLSDPVIKLSRDVCDKAKHMHLTHRDRVNPMTAIVGSDWSEEGAIWILMSGRKSIGVHMLATNALEKWKDFFDRNNL